MSMIFPYFLLQTATAQPNSINFNDSYASQQPVYWGGEGHGPEKPPPDDGYEFKGAKGGNALGKLGLVCAGAGTVTTVMMLRADKNSDKRQSLAYTSGGLWLGGIVLLVIERSS